MAWTTICSAVGVERCKGQHCPAALEAELIRTSMHSLSDPLNHGKSDQRRSMNSNVAAGPQFTPPVVLSLENCLKPSTLDQQFMEIEHNFKEMQKSWPHDALIWTLDFVHQLPDLPQELRHWILQVPIWQREPVVQTHVFIDGSSFASNRQVAEVSPSSWAFIVVLHCEVSDNDFEYRFLCAKSHPLAIAHGHQRSHDHVGEELCDSITTEAVAMIWALAWAIQSPFPCHTCFHYDNMTIGHFTEGTAQWKCPAEYQVLKRNLLALRHFLQSLGREFSFSHLKAHVGHPWSEAVDTLAKAVAKLVVLPPAQVPMVPRALKTAASSNAWLSCADFSQVPKSTALRATFQAEGPFEHQPAPDDTWHHAQGKTVTEQVQLHLGFASANVLTLEGGKLTQQTQGLLQIGRIATLQAQFCQSNCTIIGLQECRTVGSATRHSATHLVFQSGADPKGVRGCELWLDVSRPYATSSTRQFFFQAQHMSHPLMTGTSWLSSRHHT